MGDTLIYRLPSEEIIEKKGVFLERPALELENTFVVSTFEKDRSYYFVEDLSAESTLHFSENEPVCYSKEAYLRMAKEFINEIVVQRLSKAIFSRVKKKELLCDVHTVFHALCEAYPATFVYLISSQEFGTWIGATPEVLMSSRSGVGRTAALAGTMKLSDVRNWGQKEKEEQQYVTDFITEQLNAEQVEELEIVGPHEFLAGPVKHLESKFRFSMRDKNPLDLALKLHPTPAVSGLPRKEAIRLIHDVEKHDRALYTGFIGLLGNNADLFVNLRCAQVIENDWYLYLGGGFTKDSDAEREWEETENKSRTLLDILENL